VRISSAFFFAEAYRLCLESTVGLPCGQKSL
jgi:hypothetical protein